MIYNTPPGAKLGRLWGRIYSEFSQRKLFVSEVSNFFSGVISWWYPDLEHTHKQRVGVLNAKTPLLEAEFKIWPLKSTPEETYFRNKF